MSDVSQSHDAFGFSAVSSTKERIKNIKPSTVAADAAIDLARIDAIAESAGFTSREASRDTELTQLRDPRPRPEPRIPLNMRVPVSLGEAFQRFCAKERYSYPEGLEEIMRRAGLPLK